MVHVHNTCMVHSFKFWRNKVQAEIRSCKETYYKNKVHNMKDYDVSKWWKEIKKLGYMVLAKRNGVNN
jgi:hypothetical protein